MTRHKFILCNRRSVAHSWVGRPCQCTSFSLFLPATPLLLAGAPFHLTQRGISLFALTGVTGALASLPPQAGWRTMGTDGRRPWRAPSGGGGICRHLCSGRPDIGSAGGAVPAAILVESGLTLKVVIARARSTGSRRACAAG